MWVSGITIFRSYDRAPCTASRAGAQSVLLRLEDLDFAQEAVTADQVIRLEDQICEEVKGHRFSMSEIQRDGRAAAQDEGMSTDVRELRP